MLEDELKNIWQYSTKEVLVKFNTSRLLIDLDAKLETFDRTIKNRDRLEIGAAALVILFMGTTFFYTPQLLSKIGLLVGVCYGILVIYVLRNVKKFKADNYSLPMKAYLIKHQEYLIKQRNLLKNVLYWYILPPTVSVILFFMGKDMGYIHMLLVIGIMTFIYVINQRAVKKDFDPLIKKIGSAIKELETAEVLPPPRPPLQAGE